jgi:glycerol kinase
LNVGGTLRAGGDAGVATIAWTHAGRATYCLEGIINYAAATIEWLRNQLELIEDPAETEAIASSVPDSGGVYLVPAFVGLSAPHWSPEARGAIVGLSPGSGKAHVVRAALESIAYQVHDVLDAMRRSGGTELGSIHADGGATRNRLLMQFIADICGVSIVAADVPECSALGAALAGGLGSGIYKSLDELSRLRRAQTVYAPSMTPARREELLAGWRRAVRQVVRGTEP